MVLIVGLGNPGKEYSNTRHNVGFMALDFLSETYNIDINRAKFKGVYGEGVIENQKVILLKPETYMNLSGESIKSLSDFYKIDPKDIIIVYDDISLSLGRLRIKTKGSAGGHNGIKSIISCLGTDVFPRVKVGVGAPKGDLVKYVLGKFSKQEDQVLQDVLNTTVSAIKEMVIDGSEKAMNEFNGFVSSKSM